MKTIYQPYSVEYFEEVTVDIQLLTVIGTKQEADDVATSTYNVRLFPDRLTLQLKGEKSLVTLQKERLFFELCTKPIDLSTYSHDQIMALFHDPDRIMTPDDYKKMDWTAQDAYRYLIERYTPKNKEGYFAFDPLAYRVDEVKEAYKMGTCDVCEKEDVPLKKAHDGFDVYIVDVCAPSCQLT